MMSVSMQHWAYTLVQEFFFSFYRCSELLRPVLPTVITCFALFHPSVAENQDSLITTTTFIFQKWRFQRYPYQ